MSPERAVLAALLALAVTVLGGCASIPTDGPVVEGLSGDEDVDTGFEVLPVGPGVDETPESIVRGFLLAAGGVEDDFGVARTFLTPTARTGWQPTQSTVVYGTAPEVTLFDPSGAALPEAGAEAETVTARVVVPVVATIDADGRYVPAPAGTTEQVELGIQKVSGQWRIGQVADEVLVDSSEFDLVYRGYELFFLDPTGTFLVPETRWFPDRPSTATALVTQLLAGPSQWLSAAVTTAFPAGTGLDLDAVPVEEGTAQVDLTPPARVASPEARALMQAQLEATLGPVTTVTSVEMTVDSSPLELPAQPAQVRRDPGVDDSPVLVTDVTLVRPDDGALTPVEGLPPLEGLAISNPAISYGETSYAVLAGQRSRLMHLVPGSDTVPEPLVTGADLTAPSFDLLGWIWSTPAQSVGVVRATTGEGDVAEVQAGWLAGRRVTSLRIARDGTRAVIASTDPAGQGHVDVAGVVRDPGGTPELLQPMGEGVVGTGLVRVVEAVWVDEVRVAVLGRRDVDTEDRVQVLRLGGPAQPPLAPPPGAVSLAAAKGQASIVVGTSDGELLVQAGAVWVGQAGVSGVRDPAFVG